MKIKAYNIKLKENDKVVAQKGDGYLIGTVAEVRKSIQAGNPMVIYVIHWEDGGISRYPNGTVQISQLRKAK